MKFVLIISVLLALTIKASPNRDEVLKEIEKVHQFIYVPKESEFDTLVNYTPLVLVCFFDPAQGNFQLLSSYLQSVLGRVN